VAVVSVMADDSVLKMGAVEYLIKPVAKDKLLAMVRRLAPRAK